MTTVSSTGASTTYVAPATTTSTADTSSTATANTDTPYDGNAAVAQAQALAAQQLADGSSGSSGSLLGLDSNILDLLQGGSGSSEIGDLLGSSGGNAFLGAQTNIALYGAAQKLAQATQSVDRVSDIISAQNTILNTASAAAVAAVTASDTASTDGTTSADTTA